MIGLKSALRRRNIANKNMVTGTGVLCRIQLCMRGRYKFVFVMKLNERNYVIKTFIFLDLLLTINININ